MTQEVLLEQKPSLAICHKEGTGRNIKGSENWSDRDYRARPGRWAHTAARGTAWPTTRTSAQHTATPLLSSLSSLLRTSPKSWVADLWGPSPAPTCPSEKGKGTRAHLVSGLLSGRLLLSKRGFLQKEENALRKEELARNPKNNKHLSLSPDTHFQNHSQNDANINPYSDFLPEKSILQDTPNPCTTVRSSSPDALLWTLLPQQPLASPAQSDHGILAPSPLIKSSAKSFQASHLFKHKNSPPLLFLPQHYIST